MRLFPIATSLIRNGRDNNKVGITRKLSGIPDNSCKLGIFCFEKLTEKDSVLVICCIERVKNLLLG